jgi:hypothetical protein
MRHQVTNATFLCICTLVPYSDGGTWIVKAGETAEITIDGKTYKVAASAKRNRTFKVTHHGEIILRD